jgi:hypothetical protein
MDGAVLLRGMLRNQVVDTHLCAVPVGQSERVAIWHARGAGQHRGGLAAKGWDNDG